jgi:uncharacterized protein (DUF608 family)
LKIKQTIQHESGIPLGGIGTGSVEIRPDGLFHDWHIFNNGPWNAQCECCAKVAGPAPDDLVFMVRTETPDGQVLARFLALREQLHELYSFPWARSVNAISFDGRFPVAVLSYEDEALPVQVTAEVFSPFIPLDSRASGTPGFYVHFSARNLADQPVKVSIMGAMKNAAGIGIDGRRPRNVLHDIPNGKAVHLTAEVPDSNACSAGDMTFALAGSQVSYVTGTFDKDISTPRFRVNHGHYVPVHFLNQFYTKGRLPDLNAEVPPVIPEGLSAANMSSTDRAKLRDDLTRYPVFYDLWELVGGIGREEVESDEFIDNQINYARKLTEDPANWGWTALCTTSDIAPDAEADAVFTVGWYFPNHISPTGENLGHQYQHWFGSSLDVAGYLLSNFTDLRTKTLAVPDSIHDATLPGKVADAITGQLSTLTKCSWWTKAGDFGVWEGYGCCGFHTTDITYQGSFQIAALFPDLQKRQMEMGARFQREDGRVHHFFRPDFSKVDDGFDRVDMNQQFVMLVARDYLWTGDKAYLERMWPHITRAMDNTALLDTDGDGLPDQDTRRNTYDAWNFTGCPSYIASLWLGALKAGIRVADEIGDSARAAQWRSDFDKALANFEDKLWNGDYYVLWRDGDEKDEACMSDQISGDWFCTSSGWGPIVRPDRAKRALQSIVGNCFRESRGLVNAEVPPGKKRWLASTCNMQAPGVWTGIEYTVAALLIYHGMIDEGLAVVNDIHDRYLRAGRFWNHVECGNHYYRAMSSWTLLHALTGFTWDAPKGELGFAPAFDLSAHDYPFFASTAWGTYSQESDRLVSIVLEGGSLVVKRLLLPMKAVSRVTLAGEDQAFAAESTDSGVSLTFAEQLQIGQGQVLTIS